MTEEIRYTIGQLAEEAGITARTIRYYVEQGLLSPPQRRGRYTCYTHHDLNRLHLIAKLKRAYLPLSTIRTQLQGLSEAQIEAMVVNDPLVTDENVPLRFGIQPTEPHSGQSDALYLSQILAITGQATPPQSEENRPLKRVLLVSPVASPTTKPDASIPHEAWARVSLTAEIELHLRLSNSALNPTYPEQMIQEIREACENILKKYTP